VRAPYYYKFIYCIICSIGPCDALSTKKLHRNCAETAQYNSLQTPCAVPGAGITVLYMSATMFSCR